MQLLVHAGLTCALAGTATWCASRAPCALWPSRTLVCGAWSSAFQTLSMGLWVAASTCRHNAV